MSGRKVDRRKTDPLVQISCILTTNIRTVRTTKQGREPVCCGLCKGYIGKYELIAKLRLPSKPIYNREGKIMGEFLPRYQKAHLECVLGKVRDDQAQYLDCEEDRKKRRRRLSRERMREYRAQLTPEQETIERIKARERMRQYRQRKRGASGVGK